MRIIDDIKLDFSDVLIVPKRSALSSRQNVELTKTIKWKHGETLTAIPIIAANMDGVGTPTMATELSKFNCLTALTKHIELPILQQIWAETQFSNRIYSLGISELDLKKFDQFADFVQSNTFQPIDIMVCIDVANGYSQSFVDFCKSFAEKYPNTKIMAGNVVTPEITEELLLNGVSAVKIGIGSGSVCLTRQQTGIGYPQLSAVIECADAAHGLKGHVISDGGCMVPGDIAKAFGAGADFVMLGSMLAGHLESELEILGDQVQYYGMSSKTAQNNHGSFKDYRASEGRTTSIPFKGKVEDSIKEILGGLRSACTYVGANSLKELPKRTTFIRVNNQLNRSLEKFDQGK